MPRQDGLPTNKEMLTQFNALAGSLYTSAFNNDLAGNVPRLVQGKPVAFIELAVEQNYPESRQFNIIASEHLTVQPLSVATAESLSKPGDEIQQYVSMAQALTGLVVDGTFCFDNPLPPGAINAEYTAKQTPGGSRHVATFKLNPAKPSIAMASHFTDQALAYVQSSDFAHGRSAIDAGDDGLRIIGHRFSVPMVPDLPLSGREPEGYLRSFAETMRAQAENRKNRLNRVQQQGMPDVVVSEERQRYQKYHTAYLRAQAFLNES